MSHTKQWVSGAVIGLCMVGSMAAIWNVFHKSTPGTGMEMTRETEGSSSAQQASPADLHSVRERFSFAPYPYEASSFTPSIPDAKADIGELTNLNNFEHPVEPQKGSGTQTEPYQFSEEQRQSLTGKNFFVAPVHDLSYENDPAIESRRVDDWTQVYGKIGGYGGDFYRAPENAPFVTTDYMLHVYHRLLEKEFEHAEQSKMYGVVHGLSQALFKQALSEAESTQDAYQKQSAARLSGFFAVPLVMTESVQGEAQADSTADTGADTLTAALKVLDRYRTGMDPVIADQAKQELTLIYAATDTQAQSPLFGQYQKAVNPNYFEDYTQYGPRSHYAKNSVLRSYFRSMMWFGRQNFLAASPDLMRDSLTIARWMGSGDLKKQWESIYDPTTFFVGESDDMGIYEYQDLLKQISSGTTITGDDIRRAQELIKTYRGPAILSTALVGDSVTTSTKEDLLESTRGFRFMGQRFTPDAFIFNRLTKGQEQGPNLPSMPTALMVTAAFGDKASEPLLEQWITKQAPESRHAIHARLDELKHKFAGLPDDMWTQNIYWGWIRTLTTLFQEPSQLTGYPFFMRQDAWRAKDTNAVLGSWTELKHDTLLYAKQSYAEMGGGGDEPTKKPAVPKGYVEPNIAFWDRLLALSQMTYVGMNGQGLLDQEMQSRNDQFLKSLKFFREVAVEEIENKTISEQDFERLRTEPGTLSDVLRALPGDVDTEDNARAALIADVHTDVPGGQILYEATGKPDSIFVAVKDANGARLTRGLVYSYYEFAGPLAKRLTDKDWRASIYDDKTLSADGSGTIPTPQVPQWTSQLR